MAIAPLRSAALAARNAPHGKPFAGLIDAVIVESRAENTFEGSVSAEHAASAWLWMTRELAPDLVDLEALNSLPDPAVALDAVAPELLARARQALGKAQTDFEAGRRIRSLMGGEDGWTRLPVVLNALRCRALLEKARAFGRAANAMADETSLALALQAMPMQDKAVAALLMHAAVGQVAAPLRLVNAAIRIANSPEEGALDRAGFTPLIDAMLAHAQNQIPVMSQAGAFIDMDLVCRGVDRFHRLLRAVTGYVELNRGSRWSNIVAGLTKSASDRIEPKLRDVFPDINMALRRRDGADRVDGDQILSAMNGMYLLATVRDSRDSLAVNALFDQVWSQTGQALEIHIERNLDYLRRAPSDMVTSARIDAALKMAEIRFSPEYAETMRRAREVAERRTSS